jgi:Flp pilus assembly protein TadB
MVKTLWAIVAGVIMLLLSALGIEKNKTKKERNAKEEAEAERDRLHFVVEVQEEVDKIKDELVTKKEQVADDLEEAKGEIKDVKGVELSEEVKKAASNQFDRMRDRSSE